MTIDDLITELLRRQDELTRIRTATELLPGAAKTTTGLGEAITAVDRCVERLKRAIEDAAGAGDVIRGAAKVVVARATADALSNVLPAWNYSLDGYEPREGDWVLWSWPSFKGGPHARGTVVAIIAADAISVHCTDGTRYAVALADVVAFWRPPAPPEVPE